MKGLDFAFFHSMLQLFQSFILSLVLWSVDNNCGFQFQKIPKKKSRELPCSWMSNHWANVIMLFACSQLIFNNSDKCHWVRRLNPDVTKCELQPEWWTGFLGKERRLTSRISTMEATFQYHIIDFTIFQTNSFDFLSEFALLVSCTTCSAYSSALSSESEKTFQ